MQPDNPYVENRILSVLTLLSFPLLWGIIFLLAQGCTKPKAPATTSPTVIYADTTRVKLVHRADSAGRAVVIVSQIADSTLKAHGKVVQRYDSIQLDLSPWMPPAPRHFFSIYDSTANPHGTLP